MGIARDVDKSPSIVRYWKSTSVLYVTFKYDNNYNSSFLSLRNGAR